MANSIDSLELDCTIDPPPQYCRDVVGPKQGPSAFYSLKKVVLLYTAYYLVVNLKHKWLRCLADSFVSLL